MTDNLISLEEWQRQFPPGTHTHSCCFVRVTPFPQLPANIGDFPADMRFDWPNRLIFGYNGYSPAFVGRTDVRIYLS